MNDSEQMPDFDRQPSLDAYSQDTIYDEGSPEGRYSRRRALKWLIRVGYGAFALAFLVPALAVRALTRQTQTVEAGDVLVRATGAAMAQEGDPLLAAEIEEGTGLQSYPEGKSDNAANLIQVVRIAPGDGVEGLVAFSAICTHLGCPVYAALNQDGLISCPCHASNFDPANDAEVVGGPATRPLPSLPITLDDEGRVVAAGPFDGPTGPL